MHATRILALGASLGLFIVALLGLFGGAPASAAPFMLAQAQLQAGAPGLISYQGHLSTASGQAFTGNATFRFAIYTAATGGSLLWEETQSSIPVGAGFFTVQLGSVTPLDADVFNDLTRYLQVSVDTGSGFEALPRQRLTAVPYALHAEVARSVIGYENRITVAKSGGDYTSVAEALASISNPSATNRFLVWVAPGVYTETALLAVREYVHLQGAGPNVTIISAARTAATPNDTAAVARLYDTGRISSLTIRNTGTGTFAIGVWSADASRSALIDDTIIEANGAGGTGHYAMYLSDAEPTIQASILRASGATGFGTGVNAALGVVNTSAGFPQPFITGSMLLGGTVDPNGKSCAGNTGTGFGLQYTNAAALIRDSYICGDHRAIFGGVNGITRIEGAKLEVSSTTGAFLIETTSAASITIATSGVFYVSNKHTGTGAITCIHSYKANYTAASDGTTVATACN